MLTFDRNRVKMIKNTEVSEMIAEERRNRIFEILDEKGYVEVAELANFLDFSEETVRRDLKELEAAGKLQRTHGGAMKVADMPAIEVKSLVEEKVASENEYEDIAWYAPTRAPFRLCGFPFYETDGVYRRYPLNPPKNLPENVEELSWATTGGQIHFSAELSKLALKVKLSSPPYSSYNRSPLAEGGFDIYAAEGDGNYRLCAITGYDVSTDSYQCIPLKLTKKKKLDIIINFPIGTGVEKVLVGIDKGATPETPPALSSDKRVLIYGGSIMHGYCASRPGMIMPNILSRLLGREVVNLGVNGSAKCEPEVALAARMVPNVDWFIMSPEGNCPSVAWMEEHMPEFISLYREANPDTKIVLMSYMRESREAFDDAAREKREAKRACEQRIVEDFRKKGDKNIFFWDGEEFCVGSDDSLLSSSAVSEENTVDTVHKSDMGFLQMARAMHERMTKK